MELLWIVAGVIYIIYKGFKEETAKTVFLFKIIGAFVGLFIIPFLVIDEIVSTAPIGDSFADFLKLIPFITLIGGIVYRVKKEDRANSEEGIQKLKEELKQSFDRAGQPISDSMIDMLVSDISSPIHDMNKLKVSVRDCYRWLCLQRSIELNNMDDDALSKVLGVRIKDIPLDGGRVSEWAIRRRKTLAVQYILEKDGLQLTDFDANMSWMRDISNYKAIFTEYVNKHRTK